MSQSSRTIGVVELRTHDTVDRPRVPALVTESSTLATVTDRAADLAAIRAALGSVVADETASSLVVAGDSLELLSKFPDASVSLILTDPPYHTTKKSSIVGDTSFEEDEHFVEWIGEYAAHWKRILKPSGTVYVFCSSQMSARLEVRIARHLRPIGHVVWTKPNEPGYDGWKGKMKKEALRTWYPHSERILMFEHGSYGTAEAYRRSPMGQYLLECRKASGLSMMQLTELAGAYGKVNRGGAVANWEAGRNIPSPDQYARIRAALEINGCPRMLDYEDLIRPMRVSKDVEFTDVWNFMSVRPFKGKHPAEKPQDMLMHIVEASSYPGDIVLDCFAGSGSTGVAALRLGRRAVCIELEEQWVKRSARELADVAAAEDYHPPVRIHHMTKSGLAPNSLFD